MKNILKVGLYSDRMHNEKCPKCKCLFEYDDVEMICNNQYYGEDYEAHVVCPQSCYHIEIIFDYNVTD